MTCERKLDRGQVQEKLRLLAEEITEDLSRLESAQSKELLSDFVSELFLSMAKQDQQAVRRQKQAEGIAAAKARGVRFGRLGSLCRRTFRKTTALGRAGK